VGANGISTADATNYPHFAIFASVGSVQSTKVTINLISNQTTLAVSKIMDTSSGRLINKGDEIVLQASVTNPSGVTA
jgi:hypothetical protein